MTFYIYYLSSIDLFCASLISICEREEREEKENEGVAVCVRRGGGGGGGGRGGGGSHTPRQIKVIDEEERTRE